MKSVKTYKLEKGLNNLDLTLLALSGDINIGALVNNLDLITKPFPVFQFEEGAGEGLVYSKLSAHVSGLILNKSHETFENWLRLEGDLPLRFSKNSTLNETHSYYEDCADKINFSDDYDFNESDCFGYLLAFEESFYLKLNKDKTTNRYDYFLYINPAYSDDYVGQLISNFGLSDELEELRDRVESDSSVSSNFMRGFARLNAWKNIDFDISYRGMCSLVLMRYLMGNSEKYAFSSNDVPEYYCSKYFSKSDEQEHKREIGGKIRQYINDLLEADPFVYDYRIKGQGQSIKIINHRVLNDIYLRHYDISLSRVPFNRNQLFLLESEEEAPMLVDNDAGGSISLTENSNTLSTKEQNSMLKVTRVLYEIKRDLDFSKPFSAAETLIQFADSHELEIPSKNTVAKILTDLMNGD